MKTYKLPCPKCGGRLAYDDGNYYCFICGYEHSDCAYQRMYYLNHLEVKRAFARAYYHSHKEQRKAYRKAHPERHSIWDRDYYMSHREQINTYKRRWRQERESLAVVLAQRTEIKR